MPPTDRRPATAAVRVVALALGRRWPCRLVAAGELELVAVAACGDVGLAVPLLALYERGFWGWAEQVAESLRESGYASVGVMRDG